MKTTAATLVLLAAACDCGGGPARDAGPDAGAPDDAGPQPDVAPLPDAGPWDGGIAEPIPPEPPRIAWIDAGAGEEPVPDFAPAALPVLTPCPRGWREVRDGEATVCDPWPASGRASCPADQAHFPGEPACRRVGSACTFDGWPDPALLGVPESEVTFVRAGAAGAPDGTRAAPYPTIGAALAAAAGPRIIAVGAGRYDEQLTLSRGVLIRGACARDTVVTAPAPSEDTGTLAVTATGVAVYDVTIAGDRPGVTVSATGEIDLEGVIVDGAGRVGLRVEGGMLRGRDVVVRGTRARPGAGGGGRSIEVAAGVATVGPAVLEGGTGGIVANGATASAAGVDVAIVDPSGGGGDGGRGVWAQLGAGVRLDRSVIRGGRLEAVSATGGSRVVLDDVVIHDTADGHAVSAASGSTVALTRVWTRGSVRHGVRAEDDTSELLLDDVVVEDVVPDSFARDGDGVAATDGGDVRAMRVLITGTSHAGARANGPGSTLAIQDLTVLDTAGRTNPDGLYGGAVTGRASGSLTLERVRIERSGRTGVLVAGLGTTADLRDLFVTAVSPEVGMPDEARAVAITEGADVSFERLWIEDSPSFGLSIAVGARAQARQVVVRRTAIAAIRAIDARTSMLLEDVWVSGIDPLDEATGTGIFMTSDSEVTRAVVEHCAGGCVLVGATMPDVPVHTVMRDLVVRDSMPVGEAGGLGIAVLLNTANLDLTRARIERTYAAGLFTQDAGRIVATDLVIEDVESGVDTGLYGIGLQVLDGTELDAERVRIARTRYVGVIASGPGARIALRDAVVEDVREAACGAGGPCEGVALGIGAGAYYLGALTMQRFQVTRAELCGVQVAAGGEMDLVHGEVSSSPIGANVQIDGYDLRRLMQGVAYRGNRVNLDAAGLPVPGR